VKYLKNAKCFPFAPEFKDDIEIATYNEEYADILVKHFLSLACPACPFRGPIQWTETGFEHGASIRKLWNDIFVTLFVTLTLTNSIA